MYMNRFSFLFQINPLNMGKGNFTNSEDPDEMPHDDFIRVYTICKDLQAKEYNLSFF